MISACFPPPESTPGIRPARLAQHLPDVGWQVSVVTSKTASGLTKPKEFAPWQTSGFREWIPCGEAVFGVPQMVRDGIAQHRLTPCDAILACSSPVASAIAGDILSRRLGLPVVHIHGDPWGPCRQRASIRPFWTRILEGLAERRINKNAAAVIVNTTTARADYLRKFPFLGPDRLHVLRSPADHTHSSVTDVPKFGRPTILLPGGFSDWVPPRAVFALAQALAATPEGRGMQIAVPQDPVPRPATDMIPIRVIGRQPVGHMLSFMAEADIFPAISQPSDQRIPLKLSDFLYQERPVLVLESHPNPELRAFVAFAGYGKVFPQSKPEQAAQWVIGQLAHGRHPRLPRSPDALVALSAKEVTVRLGIILDRLVDGVQ